MVEKEKKGGSGPIFRYFIIRMSPLLDKSEELKAGAAREYGLWAIHSVGIVGLQPLLCRGLCERDKLQITNARRARPWRRRGGIKCKTLAGCRGIDEIGENGFAVFSEDLNGVVVDNDFHWDGACLRVLQRR